MSAVGAVSRALDRGDELRVALQPAVAEALLARRGPAAICQRLAREVDDDVGALHLADPRAHGAGRLPLDLAGARIGRSRVASSTVTS